MARNATPEPGISGLLRQVDRLAAQVSRLASQQRSPVAPVLSDAGKVSVTDADFEAPPADGAIAVVVNTTDGTIRLAVRGEGVWKITAALS